MNKFVKSIVFSIAALALTTACNDLEGTTTVNLPLKFNTQPFATTQGVVPPGTYPTEITKEKKDIVQLALKYGNKQEFELKLKAPKNSSIPSDGPFALPSATSGQPFDLSGNVNNQYERSQIYRDYESCRYQERERYCYPDGNGRTRCEIRYVDRWGRQEVEYYYETHIRTITFALVAVGTSPRTPQANFNTVQRTNSKRYTYQGRCY